MSTDDHEDLIATLARIRRAIADLESEYGRGAELRERFAAILNDVKMATRGEGRRAWPNDRPQGVTAESKTSRALNSGRDPSWLVDELFDQAVNLIKLKLKLRGARELQGELLANFHELIINQRKHFGGAHSRSCRSRRPRRTTFTLDAPFAARPLFALRAPFAPRATCVLPRAVLCHLCSLRTVQSTVRTAARG